MRIGGDRGLTGFTIVLPTTGDRAPTLAPVLRQLQLQSLADWELFVIGDGVTDQTREALAQWCREDARIRFFDHPKDVSRGERNRHAALAQAQGRNVAYLCDRDLWLYDHLETLARALEKTEFAHTRRLSVAADGRLSYPVDIDLCEPGQREHFRRHGMHVGMSQVGHRLSSYRRLPHGWRTTPPGFRTDRYMWAQFLEGDFSAGSEAWPTVLYFNRGEYPGLPSAQRAAELERWQRALADVDSQRAFRERAIRELAGPVNRARQAWRSWLFWHPGALRAYQRLRGSAG